ncbi:MAG: hypothetical protein ACF8PN_15635 [Phycisphaerales bacterium]
MVDDRVGSPNESNDGAEPPVRVAELDANDLAALQRDLDAHVDIESVRIRAGGRDERLDGEDRLDRVIVAIGSGEAVAAQIRYRFDGARWCDTLMCRGGAIRLVRMRNPPDI